MFIRTRCAFKEDADTMQVFTLGILGKCLLEAVWVRILSGSDTRPPADSVNLVLHNWWERIQPKTGYSTEVGGPMLLPDTNVTANLGRLTFDRDICIIILHHHQSLISWNGIVILLRVSATSIYVTYNELLSLAGSVYCVHLSMVGAGQSDSIDMLVWLMHTSIIARECKGDPRPLIWDNPQFI